MRQITLDKVKRANELMAKGIGITEACKKAKLSYVSYCKANKEPNDAKVFLFEDSAAKHDIDSTKLSALNSRERFSKWCGGLREGNDIEIEKLKAQNVAFRKLIKELL